MASPLAVDVVDTTAGVWEKYSIPQSAESLFFRERAGAAFDIAGVAAPVAGATLAGDGFLGISANSGFSFPANTPGDVWFRTVANGTIEISNRRGN